MKVFAHPLLVASFVAILAVPPCTAASDSPNSGMDEQPQMDLPPDGLPPVEPIGDPSSSGDYCLLTGIACVGGIVGIVPACEAACATVIGCIGCGGAAAGVVSACLNYSENCISTNAREGDLCIKSNRCETGGLHCVDNRCTASRGAEGQRCSTERDCQVGVSCLPDGVGMEGGKCWRPRGTGELCGSRAECQAGLICDPNNHSCRAPGCGEVIGQPLNTADCPCLIDQAHPAPQGDCLNGFQCDNGRCTQVTVTICNCDGTDAPGTCLSCQPTSGGLSPTSFYYYQPTCYNFYDEQHWRTCATYQGETSCDEGMDLILTDRFCV
jgi:hypothetical protein